jgi:hypothetical protein
MSSVAQGAGFPGETTYRRQHRTGWASRRGLAFMH